MSAGILRRSPPGGKNERKGSERYIVWVANDGVDIQSRGFRRTNQQADTRDVRKLRE
jgi:hypothetical protein